MMNAAAHLPKVWVTSACVDLTLLAFWMSPFSIGRLKRDPIGCLTVDTARENRSLAALSKFFRAANTPESLKQELDGHWLFATRGPDTGKKRRDDSNARKTLKVLQDNTFQWIAYNTETMKFSGTGGGSFSSEEGVYIEKINFFSRDYARVGARLEFNYDLKGDDWHHTGKNSKGEPMYKIWARRVSSQ